jgi:hypothetical protein
MSDNEEAAGAQEPFNWREHVHPACAAMPEMSRAERIALGNDIKAGCLRQPIVFHAEGDTFSLIDGRSRLMSMDEVGIQYSFERVYREEHKQTSLRLNIPGVCGVPGGNAQTARGFSAWEIGNLVASLNLHRRHLSGEQKRAAIDALLKLHPEESDRQIAKKTKSTPTTVGARRKKGEETGDVSKLDTRTDTKGRKQPAKRIPVHLLPENKALADEAAAKGFTLKVRKPRGRSSSFEIRKGRDGWCCSTPEEVRAYLDEQQPAVSGTVEMPIETAKGRYEDDAAEDHADNDAGEQVEDKGGVAVGIFGLEASRAAAAGLNQLLFCETKLKGVNLDALAMHARGSDEGVTRLRRLADLMQGIITALDDEERDEQGEVAVETAVVDDVEHAREVHKNILESIKDAKAVAEAWRKVTTPLTFDGEQKDQIVTEIGLLTRKRACVRSAVNSDPSPPSDGGGREIAKPVAGAEASARRTIVAGAAEVHVS